MKILLIEPKSSTTYPPMGLMKLCRYHRLLGDKPSYVVGKNKDAAQNFWDRLYITSVFTYDYKALIETIQFYSANLFNFENIIVGGVAATLLADKVRKETGVKVHEGLLNEHDPDLAKIAQQNPDYSYLNKTGYSIDNLPPDYEIVEVNTKYSKIIDHSFFLYSTKGCPNRCPFCAVPKLEPDYVDYIPIKERIEVLRNEVGDRAGLLFLDNNIAASNKFFKIISEIKECGYGAGTKMAYKRGGKTYYKKRFVDFNQGVDLRLLDKEKMEALATIAIEPLRLAFDDITLSEQYIAKANLAISCGIKRLSNYMLFNYKDRPEDLYRRMEINVDIIRDHQDENVRIFSFPMRYSPVNQTNRNYIGKHWSKRQIRAVQLILQATHGIVSHSLSQDRSGKGYFYRAFGSNEDEFLKILWMPTHYIINRNFYEYELGYIDEWLHDFDCLTRSEKDQIFSILAKGKISPEDSAQHTFLKKYYLNEHTNIEKHAG